MKTMKVVCLVSLAFTFLASVVYTQEKDNPHALKIWEKVILAKGGRDKLFAINTLAITTKGKNSNDESQFQNLFMQELYVLPDRWWQWVDERPGFPLDVVQFDFTKEIGFEVSELSSKVIEFRPRIPVKSGVVSDLVLDGSTFNNNFKERFLKNQMIYLMETRWFRPKVTGFRTEGKGKKKTEIVEASFGRTRFEYFLDSKTNLPSKINIITWIVQTQSSNEDTFYVSDYVDMNGVKVPQVISRGKGDDKRTSYKINISYDKNLFDRQPSIEAGPNAWKSKNE